MVDVVICVSSHLKEELTWAVNKRLLVFSITTLCKNSKSTKELKGIKEKSFFKFKTILYTLLCGP